MNDFTKDELINIKNCINEAYRSCCVNPDITFDLRLKIKSLIDNYCEDKNNDMVCMNCGEIYIKSAQSKSDTIFNERE
jgi:hypothetical protein